MFRSWKIARVAGIDLYVHATFLLLLGWIGLSSLSLGNGLLIGLQLLMPIMLFGIVVLHELGHALMARRFGIPTHDITLYPIGGVARLAGAPRTWRQELAVAAAGPAVNLVLALVSWTLLPLLDQPLPALLLSQFMLYNLGLMLFNLLPAFPMDGGRILKAFLARRGDNLTATRTAARIGRGMAWVLGLVGLFTFNLNLMLIAVFIWLAGSAELAQARFASWLNRGQTYRDPRIIDAEYYVIRH